MTVHKLILLIDDDPDVQRSLRHMLEMTGFRVVTAADAHEAPQRIADHEPDAILTDIYMPGADGFELLRLLRQRIPGTLYLSEFRGHFSEFRGHYTCFRRACGRGPRREPRLSRWRPEGAGQRTRTTDASQR